MGERVVSAQVDALRRRRREGRQLAPLRVAVTAIVVAVALTSTPSVGLAGRHLALSACVLLFVVEMLGWPLLRVDVLLVRASELLVMGGAGVAIAAIQPNGLNVLPASAVVFTAGVALTPMLAAVVGAIVTAAVVVTLAVAGTGGAGVGAEALLCAVLGLTGALLRRYRIGQDRTELLLAELEEARDDQARAAAAQERARIARELHDVLAHSLSGLSIQLETARKLAKATDAAVELSTAIDGAAGLAKRGVLEARKAVGTLRQDDRLGPDRLPELVEQYGRDFNLAVSLSVDGPPRPVSPELGLTLYRVTGEALTNVARHAAGSTTLVRLSYAPGQVRLEVTNEGGQPSEVAAHSGGWGLAGVRERLKRLGGELSAGPTELGWSVVASVPA